MCARRHSRDCVAGNACAGRSHRRCNARPGDMRPPAKRGRRQRSAAVVDPHPVPAQRIGADPDHRCGRRRCHPQGKRSLAGSDQAPSYPERCSARDALSGHNGSPQACTPSTDRRSYRRSRRAGQDKPRRHTHRRSRCPPRLRRCSAWSPSCTALCFRRSAEGSSRRSPTTTRPRSRAYGTLPIGTG